MLGIVVLIFIIFLTIKMGIKLNHHKQVMIDNGIESSRIILLQASCFLYIVSLAGFTLPFDWLNLFRPVPVGFMLLLPGIILGKRISSTMEVVGIRDAVAASRDVSNIMWLGVATGVFIAANISLKLLFSNIGGNLVN